MNVEDVATWKFLLLMLLFTTADLEKLHQLCIILIVSINV